MKKMMIVFLATAMIMLFSVPAFAYNDMSDCTDVQKQAIDNLTKLEIVGGYDDGTFQPAATITRAEFAKVAVETKRINKTTAYPGTQNDAYSFSDLKKDAWYMSWIDTACKAGMLKGYEDGTFRPNADITGNEVVTVLMRMLGYEDENLNGVWPQNYINEAKKIGVMKNVNLDMSKAISRADVCVLVTNVLEYEKEDPKPVVSSAEKFCYIKDFGIKTSKVDYGVKIFADDNMYENSSKSASVLQKNVLYQFSVRNNEIRLNPVDTAKEQIQEKEVVNFSEDLYNVQQEAGKESQFVLADSTVVIKVTYENGNVESVEYGSKIKKGDIVTVRYNVKAEDQKEAAYVVIKKEK